jgi:hypothetical protein
MTAGRWWPLLITLVLASSFVDFQVRQYKDYPHVDYIPKVVDGTYGAPATYRVLVPFLNTALEKATGASAGTIWHITRILWFLLAYLALFAYLRQWFSAEAAVGGVFATAATLPLTYTNSWAHPDSIPELALFTLGCLAVVRRAELSGLLILIVATLNRETAVFLVVAYLLAGPWSWPHMTKAFGAGAIAVSVLIGLRLWRGVEHYDYWQLDRNIAFLGLLPANYDVYKRAYAWFIVALAGPACLLLARGWNRVPSDARRLAMSAIPFVIIGFTFSSIIEPRIFIPLIPLLLPALMCTLLQPIERSEEILL